MPKKESKDESPIVVGRRFKYIKLSFAIHISITSSAYTKKKPSGNNTPKKLTEATLMAIFLANVQKCENRGVVIG